MRIGSRKADGWWPSFDRVCSAESVIRGCIENGLFATEYPGVIECSVMRAQDVLIIPFQLSGQELGSKLDEAGTDTEVFITAAHATGRFYYCTVLPDLLDGEASYAIASIGSAGGNF